MAYMLRTVGLQSDVVLRPVCQQPHDLQLVHGVKECVVGFAVCPVAGEQAEYGLHTVAPLQPAGGAQVGGAGDFGVVLTVGRQPHDIVPVKSCQLRQMIPVEVCVISENGGDIVVRKPVEQIAHGLPPGAEDRLHRRVQKQRVVIHTADLAIHRQNMIFGCDGPEGVRVRKTTADRHDLVRPVGFCVDDCKVFHRYNLSFLSSIIVAERTASVNQNIIKEIPPDLLTDCCKRSGGVWRRRCGSLRRNDFGLYFAFRQAVNNA